ncbi:RNA polymerase sigma factor region1.1 domain-containing protein [Methylobacterium oryzihabitans]|uniref:RNA polymerase sigma factor 70 region 1.1 domain-containing protein n=1 Tax=Methylobacterium oryzihabitans TaxID=2499852 RepID=A0A3S2YM05_9HYPH|nr:RNA polymerase sigma factor region1.1 domain-containing protein [Methylobacterium oryzihabitans]RVU14549.1 hypothetical protein EOE48_22700 [Methylobacterium oryzihabitans]
MEAGIDRATLDRLIALGRRRDGLTTEDLRQALPIGGMSADAIALVVIELEDAGIPVDLDESLLGGRPGSTAAPMPAMPVPEVPPPPAGPPAPATAAPRGAAPASAAPAPGPGRAGAHRAVAIAGLAAVVLALVLVLILR